MKCKQDLEILVDNFDQSFPLLIKNIFSKQVRVDQNTERSIEIYSRVIPSVWELLKGMLSLYPTNNLFSITVSFRSYTEHWALVNYLYFKSLDDPNVFERYLEEAYEYERIQIEVQHDVDSLPEVQTKKRIKLEYTSLGKEDLFKLHQKSYSEFSFTQMCKFMDKIQSQSSNEIDKWYKLFLYVIGHYSYSSSFVHAGPISIFYYDLIKSHGNDFDLEIKNTIKYALLLFEQMNENVFKFTNSGNIMGRNIYTNAIKAFNKKVIDIIS